MEVSILNPDRVLVADHEAPMRRFLHASLEAQGFAVMEAADAGTAIQLARLHSPDLVLLALDLPESTALPLVQQLRVWTAMPILLMSPPGHAGAQVEALDAGADDAILEPFSAATLLAQVRLNLRHARQPALLPGAPLAVGPLHIDPPRVDVAGRSIELTSVESYATVETAVEAMRRGAWDILPKPFTI
jgi:two-component system KDP operon response regulator KdpE